MLDLAPRKPIPTKTTCSANQPEEGIKNLKEEPKTMSNVIHMHSLLTKLCASIDQSQSNLEEVVFWCHLSDDHANFLSLPARYTTEELWSFMDRINFEITEGLVCGQLIFKDGTKLLRGLLTPMDTEGEWMHIPPFNAELDATIPMHELQPMEYGIVHSYPNNKVISAKAGAIGHLIMRTQSMKTDRIEIVDFTNPKTGHGWAWHPDSPYNPPPNIRVKPITRAEAAEILTELGDNLVCQTKNK
jgi:hypothetical protein